MTSPTTTRPMAQGGVCPVCEDVAWLLNAGEVRERVAERVDRNMESLQRHLRAHDRPLLEWFNSATYTERRTA